MAEMRNLNCPSCERTNQPRAMVDGIEEYRCSSCGMVYYGPCGCDTVHEAVETALEVRESAEQRLPADWAMSAPAVKVENGAAALSRPGGC
jgi:ribosomal protein L37AE/L43A